ncbi:MAG: cytochrome c [Rhodocyclales bacterium]|jgi:cytochrome c55X|nr:cytochrome c [Rhodocyclales bacterium]
MILSTLLAIPFCCTAMPAAAEPSPARQKELIHLVRQDCGSCHGMTLQGGLGPALLPATLADKPVEGLVATIIGGRPGTPMPPWHRFLEEDEAQWIVARLMAGFPE